MGFAGFGVGEDGAREKTSCEGVCVERGEESGEEKEETCVCPAWECVVVSSTVSSANSSNSSNPFTSSLFVSTIRERVSVGVWVCGCGRGWGVGVGWRGWMGE